MKGEVNQDQDLEIYPLETVFEYLTSFSRKQELSRDNEQEIGSFLDQLPPIRISEGCTKLEILTSLHHASGIARCSTKFGCNIRSSISKYMFERTNVLFMVKYVYVLHKHQYSLRQKIPEVELLYARMGQSSFWNSSIKLTMNLEWHQSKYIMQIFAVLSECSTEFYEIPIKALMQVFFQDTKPPGNFMFKLWEKTIMVGKGELLTNCFIAGAQKDTKQGCYLSLVFKSLQSFNYTIFKKFVLELLRVLENSFVTKLIDSGNDLSSLKEFIRTMTSNISSCLSSDIIFDTIFNQYQYHYVFMAVIKNIETVDVLRSVLERYLLKLSLKDNYLQTFSAETHSLHTHFILSILNILTKQVDVGYFQQLLVGVTVSDYFSCSSKIVRINIFKVYQKINICADTGVKFDIKELNEYEAQQLFSFGSLHYFLNEYQKNWIGSGPKGNYSNTEIHSLNTEKKPKQKTSDYDPWCQTSSSVSYITDSDDESNSDEAIVAKRLDLNNKNKPYKMLRSLKTYLDALTQDDNSELFVLALFTLTQRISCKPLELGVYTPQLLKVLVVLNNRFNLDETKFFTEKIGAIVSLVVHCPAVASQILYQEFFSTESTISTRMFVLDTLYLSAKTLASTEIESAEQSGINYESPTNTIGTIIRRVVFTKTKRSYLQNNFNAVAKQFIYPYFTPRVVGLLQEESNCCPVYIF